MRDRRLVRLLRTEEIREKITSKQKERIHRWLDVIIILGSIDFY